MFLHKVVTAKHPDCAADQGVSLRRTSGFISSYMTEKHGYGTVSCPWRVELSRGERVNITLVDFTLPMLITGDDASASHHGRPCYQYAILTEKWSMTRHVRVCGGEQRERNIYTSRTNSVEIRIVTKKNVESEKEFFFLLQFEG